MRFTYIIYCVFVNGYLPKGIHPMSAKAFIDTFCATPIRARLYDSALLATAQDLSGKGIEILYIGGSFVTQERWPKDVDSFFEVSIAEFKTLFNGSFEQWHQFMKASYKSDCYAAFSDRKPFLWDRLEHYPHRLPRCRQRPQCPLRVREVARLR